MKRHMTPCSALLALALLGSVALGCGGSSSETPWPVEPVDTEPAPLGEARPGSEDLGRPTPTKDPEQDPEQDIDEEPDEDEPER